MEAEDETKVVDRESKLAASSDPPPPAIAAEPAHPDLVAAHPLVGRYEVIHRLGHGGMASVYLGRAIGTAGFERLVAVKVIHPHLAREPEFVEMFLDEARIAAKIHHPNVVEIIDLGEDEELFFMVMEYVEGETLSSLLRQLRKQDELLPLPAALQIVADACKGLAAAHDLVDRDGQPLQLVHRDVSPHNLLVSMDGRVKVVDFGIMKAAGKRSSTLTGQLRGKIAYMSPQQARSEKVDRRADVFALGAVLWEMVTGQRLFSGETDVETLDRVLHHRPPELAEVRPDLPAALGEIVRKALASDLDDRYSSALDMLKDVRALLRQVEGDDEPRELLALRMAKHFSGRIEYIRAAVRSGSSANLRDPNARSGLHALGDSKTTPLGALGGSSPLRLTPSVAPLQTATVTATPAPSGMRSWMLWLVLPLAGAAIGTAAVNGGWFGDRSVEAPPGEQAEVVEPANVVGDPAPDEPELVKWVINSDPQGATILIDGEPHPDPTPTVVKLPRAEKTVLVVAELDGYRRSEQLQLAPLASQNLPTFRLAPLAIESGEPDPADTKIYPRFSARTLPDGKTKKPGKAKNKASNTEAQPDTTPDSKQSERELQSMPNFGGGAK
jgi:serine/threonine protein kinase